MTTPLSSPAELLRRAKAIAALDLILSPEWEDRQYSFNSAWAPSEQMASMRDGTGNEWWLVFHESGWAALKGLDHESEAWSEGEEDLSNAIQAALPGEFQGFADEPAFCWDSTSFAYYYLPAEGAWRDASDGTAFSGLASGAEELLKLLTGKAEDYVEYASDYYEAEVPLELVEAIFSLSPITEERVTRLNPETSLEDIEEELFEQIGYPE